METFSELRRSLLSLQLYEIGEIEAWGNGDMAS